jgi:hypothetical protein
VPAVCLPWPERPPPPAAVLLQVTSALAAKKATADDLFDEPCPLYLSRVEQEVLKERLRMGNEEHGAASLINDYQAFDQALRKRCPALACSSGHELDLLARNVKRAQASPHCRVDETLAHKPK